MGIAQQGATSLEPVVALLAGAVGDDNWHEVTLLAVAYVGIIQQREEAADSILRQLMARGPGEPGEAVVLAGQAVAFCRWLSHKLGYEVDLPHEYEWEVAARYSDGRRYPWGDEFDKEKANTSESGIGQTTAVGIFPACRNPALDLYDLSGNVWEWCRNKYDQPTDAAVDKSSESRTLRGGSWFNFQSFARVAFRNDFHPSYRYHDVGFRVVVRRPPSPDH